MLSKNSEFVSIVLHDLVKAESAGKREKTIEIFRALLREIDTEQFPELVGIVKLRLATTLLVQFGKQNEAALNEAKALLENAIRVLPPEKYVDELTLVHSNLASAYSTPSWDEPEEDTERIIQHGEAALQLGGKSLNPKIRQLLADAYYERQRGDREENLDSAIKHLNDALAIAASFDEKREIHSNLAMIYADRASGGKSTNEKQARQQKKLPKKIGSR